jgi:choline dehydrogenase
VFATSADPRARPRIELHLLQHPDDLARLCEGLRRCHALVRSGAFEGLARSLALLERGALDDPAALGEYARRHCVPWYHAAGTCRMGPSPADGAVVDAQGRVYGVPGLRVFDASIMPSIPRANTNLTCIAIGERAAEILGG